MPNMYARGILFGKMVFELGDTCVAKCEKTGMQADLDFKTKVRDIRSGIGSNFFNPWSFVVKGLLYGDI